MTGENSFTLALEFAAERVGVAEVLGSGTSYRDGVGAVFSENIELYAQWTPAEPAPTEPTPNEPAPPETTPSEPVTPSPEVNTSYTQSYTKPIVQTFIVTISGEENSIKEEAKLSQKQASIGKIDLAELDTVIGTDVKTGSVII